MRAYPIMPIEASLLYFLEWFLPGGYNLSTMDWAQMFKNPVAAMFAAANFADVNIGAFFKENLTLSGGVVALPTILDLELQHGRSTEFVTKEEILSMCFAQGQRLPTFLEALLWAAVNQDFEGKFIVPFTEEQMRHTPKSDPGVIILDLRNKAQRGVQLYRNDPDGYSSRYQFLAVEKNTDPPTLRKGLRDKLDDLVTCRPGLGYTLHILGIEG